MLNYPTIIVIIIGTAISILFLLRDTLSKRNLIGITPKGYFSHPFDHESGLRLIFLKLPKFRYLGNLATLILFFLLIMYLPAMVGSYFDQTLTDPDSSDKFVAFFEESLILGGAIISGILCYIYRRAMEYVPEGIVSIAETRNVQDGNYSVSPKADTYLKSTASFIFQTGNNRKRLWLLFDILLGLILICTVAYSQSAKLWADPEITIWSDPDHLWGNMVNILVWFLLVYFIRILISYAIRLSFAMRSISSTLHEEKLLHIEPLHPDGAGGLSKFGNLAWRIVLLLFPIVLYLIFWYLDRILPGERVDDFFWVGVIAVTLLIPVVFFVPLWGLHAAMGKAKRRETGILSRYFDDNAAIMWKWLKNEGSVTRKQGLAAKENIENIITLYERASNMPVWPFSTTILVRLGGYMLVAIVPLIMKAFSG